MQHRDGLRETLGVVRTRIEAYRSQGIGEQNTKVGLIAPVLRALGWDVEDLREVHLEFRRRTTDKPVDYALMLNGAARLFVEAKALGENLDDPRWANQIVSYATVAGVRWVVLTNGDEYRIYNSHAEVPVEEKLFRIVRVSELDDDATETLALLSKESIGQLQDLWAEKFVDQRVRKVVDALFEPDPDPGIVRRIRKRLPELSSKQIRMALGRTRTPGAAPALVVEPGPPTPGPRKRKVPAAGSEGTPWRTVTLADVASEGLLQPPVAISRQYKGVMLSATIEPDIRVTFGGQSFDSLSTAAGMARRSVIGAPPGRKYPQTNGWTFWNYVDEDGRPHPLDELRQRYWERRRRD
jgi:hypothetical protein